MSTLTIRLPDDTHGRLKEIARQRGMSMNKVIEELSTLAIAQYDAETRFRAMAARGIGRRGAPHPGQARRSVRQTHALRGRTALVAGDDRTPR